MVANEQIQELIDNAELGSPPQIVLQMIESIQADKPNSEIAAYIGRDQNITGQILRLANSSFFGFRNEIKTLDRAISVLGLNMIRNMVMAAALVGKTRNLKLWNLDVEQFWMRSVLSGEFARMLAPIFDTPPEELYVAGLLHDLGKLVLYGQPQEPADRFSRPFPPAEISAYEKEMWGVQNEDVTRALLQRWQLPESLVNAAAVRNSDGNTPCSADVTFIAGELAGITLDVYRKTGLTSAALDQRLEAHGGSFEDFRKRVQKLPRTAERTKHIMQSMLGGMGNEKDSDQEQFPDQISLISFYQESLSYIMLQLMDFEISCVRPEHLNWLDKRALKDLKRQDPESGGKAKGSIKRFLGGGADQASEKDKYATDSAATIEEENLSPWVLIDGMDPNPVVAPLSDKRLFFYVNCRNISLPSDSKIIYSLPPFFFSRADFLEGVERASSK